MEKLENNLKAILILSGNVKQDLVRAKKAREYSEQSGGLERYIVAGLGPDTNEALENGTKEGLDFHKDLYNYLMQETGVVFGVDPFSMNTKENILNCFPEGTNGKYGVVSYPLHLKRFERIFNDLKEQGKISSEVEIVKIPTQQNLFEIIYEMGAFVKEKLP